MPSYQNILCAIDLDANSAKILEAAIAQAGGQLKRIHVIHTCEHPITGYGELTGSNLPTTEAQIKQKAYPEFRSILEKHQIPVSQGEILFGQPSEAINTKASELSCDLIVVGSHGRSGLQLLLGSTSNSVLKDSPCDVLTIRLEE
ncbi:universal stress protein [Pseudomaricurvus sp.]|uniref:universal stress protein n=1 Tax=Pseudomaricurvus sp. TaxID=2004510 RepID=UPI003F6C212D